MQLKKWLPLLCMASIIFASVPAAKDTEVKAAKTSSDGMVLVKGGTFRMGRAEMPI